MQILNVVILGGRIVYISPSVLAMLGYPPAEVTGRHLTAFLPQGVIDASIYRNGPFLGTLGTIRDISERISMGQALRESEERFGSLLNRPPMWCSSPTPGGSSPTCPPPP